MSLNNIQNALKQVAAYDKARVASVSDIAKMNKWKSSKVLSRDMSGDTLHGILFMVSDSLRMRGQDDVANSLDELIVNARTLDMFADICDCESITKQIVKNKIYVNEFIQQYENDVDLKMIKFEGLTNRDGKTRLLSYKLKHGFDSILEGVNQNIRYNMNTTEKLCNCT